MRRPSANIRNSKLTFPSLKVIVSDPMCWSTKLNQHQNIVHIITPFTVMLIKKKLKKRVWYETIQEGKIEMNM